jgi:hypothetical protein
MMNLLVVIVDVDLNSTIEFKSIIDGIKIDVIVFQGLPETLDPNVIQCLALQTIWKWQKP